MRYNIMLQLVVATTFVLLGAAALFAWIQTRTEPTDANSTYRDASQMIPPHWANGIRSGTRHLRQCPKAA